MIAHMLTRLIYISRAVGPQTTTITTQILETARVFNKSHNLTGVLCQGKGLYVQVLEGERSVVNSLYRRIVADNRHDHTEIVHFSEIESRKFKEWSMALVNLSKTPPKSGNDCKASHQLPTKTPNKTRQTLTQKRPKCCNKRLPT